MNNQFRYQITIYDNTIKIEDNQGDTLEKELGNWEIYNEHLLSDLIADLNESVLKEFVANKKMENKNE